jgi:peptide/nickel transport system permease protein
MTAYIIRRCLYAIPTLIGVNILVFMLFFFVNSPDDMARTHAGGKRATVEKIEAWKREHSLDLPYFYNAGWRRLGALPANAASNKAPFQTAGAGHYALVVEAPGSQKEAQARTLKVSCENGALSLPKEFDSSGTLTLPADTKTRRFELNIVLNAQDQPEPPVLNVNFDLQTVAPLNRVLLEYKGSMSFVSRLTETIFFQRSVKMLFFSYGKSDDGKDIGAEIYKRMFPSLSIAIPVLFFAMFVDIFFAMIAAFYRGTYLDYWGVILCVLLMSISGLFYIMGFQVVLGKLLRLAPVSGYDYGLHSIKFIALPIVIIIISGMGGSIRFYRTVFLEEINKDYVRTARAKGLPEVSVLFIHTLKNAMLPILTGVVAGLPFLFMGNLLLESFFAIPGMGSFMLDGIQRADFAVVQAMVCLGSFLYIVGLVMTDISYTLFDPRVRLE